MPKRTQRRSASALGVDAEIRHLTRERLVLLNRKPPRLTQATEPLFGSTSTGSGQRIVGQLAYKGTMPNTVSQWGWDKCATPPCGPRRDDPPNLYGTFTQERLPTVRNQWSIAQRSMVDPLKSLLLDDETRNIPRHQTRTQLVASRKQINIPHMSFDVDMDGVVSELDMKYAKKYDFDGDGILNKAERSSLRHAMATDLFKGRRAVANLAQFPMTDEAIEDSAATLVKSKDFTEDFNRLHQEAKRGAISGSTGCIAVMQHHFRATENREIALASDHNVPSVKTHNHGFVSPTGQRNRCISRSELLEQRRSDFRETAKLAAFSDDGRSLLFRRKADTSIQPTRV